MRQVRSIALAYDAGQDRLFASVNPGAPDASAFWITRRLALDIVARLPPALAERSAAVQQAPAQFRPEVAAFERQAAVADTGSHFTQTPNDVLRRMVAAAELLVTLSLNVQADGVAVELRGERGAGASGVWTRADVQRLLHLIEQEVVRAGWIVASAGASAPQVPPPPAGKPN